MNLGDYPALNAVPPWQLQDSLQGTANGASLPYLNPQGVGEQLVDERPVGNRRAAWCIITGVEQKEKTDGKEQQAAYAREYVGKVETELQKIFGNILALMDKIAELSIEIGSEKGGVKTDLKKHAKITREKLDWDETVELNSTGTVEKSGLAVPHALPSCRG